MRDRIESLGGTAERSTHARAGHPDPGRACPRLRPRAATAVADVRARIAWVLAGSPSSLAVADVVVTGAVPRAALRGRDRRARLPVRHGRSSAARCWARSSCRATAGTRSAGCSCLVGVIGALSLLAEAYSIWVISEAARGGSLGGVAGWISALIGGQFAIAALALMFLLAPDGRLLSRRWRYAAWVTGARRAAVLRCAVLVRTRRRSTSTPGRRHRAGPAADALASGFLLISVGPGRLRRLDGAAAAPEPRRAAAAAAPDRACGSPDRRRHRLPVRRPERHGGRADLGAVATPVRRLLPAAVLFASRCSATGSTTSSVIIDRAVVLAVGTAFAAVGYTTLVVVVGPGRQPDRQLLALTARHRRWWRWPSSRCGAASSGWPTGWPTGRARGPTRRWPSSAAGSPRRPSAGDPAAGGRRRRRPRGLGPRAPPSPSTCPASSRSPASWGGPRARPSPRRPGAQRRERPGHIAVGSCRRAAGAPVRRPAARGARRPGRGRVPQRRAARPQLAEQVAELDRTTQQLAESRAADHRRRRRRAPDARGGDLP